MNELRTIETAPRDGTPFIGARISEGVMNIAIVIGNDKLPDKGWQCVIVSAVFLNSGNTVPVLSDQALPFLTHWMPLPDGQL